MMLAKIHIVVIMVVACLSGCATTPSARDTIAPMWRDYIDQALSDPNTSDLVRHILEDYVITDAEFQEARGQFKQCMADKGWTVSFGEHTTSISGAIGGPHEGATSANDDPTQDMDQCEQLSIGPIEMIYNGLTYNPEGLSLVQSTRKCFEKYGVTDADGMTDDQLGDLLSSENYIPSSPAAELCFEDPDGSSGITMEQAEESYAYRTSHQSPSDTETTIYTVPG